jgi:hypothetical protein
MKTPMQELIKELKDLQESLDPYGLHDAIEFAESMLEKEKEQIVNAWIDDRFPLDKDWVKQCAEQYYNETYGDKKVK